MKNFQKILALLIAFVVFGACDDYTEQEFLKPLGEEIEEDILITKTQDYQAVLLEEHTGWGCTNCPRGAEKLEELKTSFGNQLVTVAIHAGTLSKPGKSNNNLDLRTEYGNTLAESFGINSRPSGIINRIQNILQYSDWESTINSLLSPTNHSMNIGLGVKESENRLLVGVEINAIKLVDAGLLLTLMVVEDNIIGVQLDGSSKVEDYIFRNVLRNNPVIDIPVTTSEMAANEVIKKNYSINIDPVWNLNNCRVVAIVTEQSSGKVLQTNEIFVRN